jgi:hypothetical protein
MELLEPSICHSEDASARRTLTEQVPDASLSMTLIKGIATVSPLVPPVARQTFEARRKRATVRSGGEVWGCGKPLEASADPSIFSPQREISPALQPGTSILVNPALPLGRAQALASPIRRHKTYPRSAGDNGLEKSMSYCFRSGVYIYRSPDSHGESRKRLG